MTGREELLMGEGQRREYKAAYTPTFLKTVCAFANYRGGMILFGIDDNKEVVGIEDTHDLALRIESAINDGITPRPDVSIDVQEISGKQVVILRVSQGEAAPYYYQNRTYKRTSTATVPVDAYELQRLTLRSANRSWDSLDTLEEDLTFRDLEEALIEAVGLDALSDNVMKTLGLLTQGGYNRAAQLLSDHPHLRHGSVEVAQFGSSISIFLHRESIEGVSLLAQYARSLELFDQFYKEYEEISGFYRVKRIQIPRDAFREALVNALVHRDYQIRASIRIAAYADRIEITSPGGLVDGITEADYLDGKVSCHRNPIIAAVFHRLGLVERFATGIKRIHQAYQYYGQHPLFDVREKNITVVLPVIDYHSVEQGVVPYVVGEPARVLSLFNRGETITRGEVQSLLKISATSAKRLLSTMVEKEILIMEGKGPAVRYRRWRP